MLADIKPSLQTFDVSANDLLYREAMKGKNFVGLGGGVVVIGMGVGGLAGFFPPILLYEAGAVILILVGIFVMFRSARDLREHLSRVGVSAQGLELETQNGQFSIAWNSEPLTLILTDYRTSKPGQGALIPCRVYVRSTAGEVSGGISSSAYDEIIQTATKGGLHASAKQYEWGRVSYLRRIRASD